MKEYQDEVDRWFKENQWEYWHSYAQITRLIEEIGEVSRILNDLYGEKPKKETEEKQDLAEEIGDVIYTLICFANSQNIGLSKPLKSASKSKKTVLAIFLRLNYQVGLLSHLVEIGSSKEILSRQISKVLSNINLLLCRLDLSFDDSIRKALDKVANRDKRRY